MTWSVNIYPFIHIVWCQHPLIWTWCHVSVFCLRFPLSTSGTTPISHGHPSISSIYPILLRHISFSTSLRALAARPRTHATALHCTSVPLYLRHPRTKALAIAWKWSVYTHRAPERVWVRIGRNEEGRSVSFVSAQEYCSCEASALYQPLRYRGQFT